jgi:hypothetical protein
MSEIKSALTAEEWSRKQWDGATADDFVYIDHRGVVMVGNNGVYNTVAVEDAAAMIALCNHALSPDDPRKIVRADVEAIREFDYRDWVNGENSVRIGQVECERLQLVAAKLAALLPPED